MNRLFILGASGHGKVVADIAVRNGYEDIVFLDDDTAIKECSGFPVIGTIQDASSLIGDKVIAIGNASIRERIQNDIETISLIHPNAVIGRNVKIGRGTVIMAGAIINSDTVIGDGCIINTASSVDHDCIVEDFVHIAVGSHICGAVKIGKSTWVGAGSTICNNTSVCSNCTIGAGAVVIKNIVEAGTYLGVPAKKRI